MSSDEEQQRLLVDASKIVREQAFYMKRDIDANNLNGAIEHATDILRELKSNTMEPRTYYDLYMKIMDELREFEEYLNTLQRAGASMVAIYEQVQSCAHIVPRIYMMICVGGVYISSLEAPAKDILTDLVEMVKGVQHPMRGLFLRNYLTQTSKNRLPDIGTPYEGVGGSVQDAVNFILQNFIETSRLWVRLQTQGNNKDRKKREKERLDLRILVGANLVRLSQLEGLDIEDYKNNALPKILEEIVSSKDKIAQNYLMDCIIQVFPDEFHLVTLDKFLATCALLKEKVNVRGILESMMDRLANYSATNGSALALEVNAFKLFNDCVSGLIETRSNMSLSEVLSMQRALLSFALRCHPSRVDYVSHCLSTCGVLLDKSTKTSEEGSTEEPSTSTNNKCTDEAVILQIEALVSAPLDILALRVLEIPHWAKLMSTLPYASWKEVSLTFLRSVVQRNAYLTEVTEVQQLFGAIAPLLRDKSEVLTSNGSGASAEAGSEGEAAANIPANDPFHAEQRLVAKVVHLMRSEDTDTLAQLYAVAKTHFEAGGPQRTRHTLAPLAFCLLALARRVQDRRRAADLGTDTAPAIGIKKIFKLIFDVVASIAAKHPVLAFKLYLQSTQAADACGLNVIAYEFAKDALILYEQRIVDSKTQPDCLRSLVGTLLHCTHFPVEDFETLVAKAGQYAGGLLQKQDQCRLMTLCAHLFYPPKHISNSNGGEVVGTVVRFEKDAKVWTCLHRALSIAQSCQLTAFVEIFDRCLYFFEHEVNSVEAIQINKIIFLITGQLGTDGERGTPVEAHFRNTIEYVRNRQVMAESAERYAAIELL